MIKYKMIRIGMYVRPDQKIWLDNQREDASTTVRALIDAEIERQEKNKNND